MTSALIDSHAVESAFYDAFRRLDAKLMRTLWLEGPTAACVHPGSDLLQGIDAVMASWADIFHAAKPPDVDFTLLSVDVRDDLAIHLVREHVSGADGQRADIIATNVYRRTRTGWRMQLHHASLPLVEARAATTPARPLH
ncbi:MAG: nuclear transport factor 2 family protein [Gammaproteobacteria bacterium]|nr:nuclear transport factor 2 family protein [Gammaproteobacteria bacterium]